MERVCINCRYVGSVVNKDGLVCSNTINFKSVSRTDTCSDFKFPKDVCACGSADVIINSFSPDDEPYLIRTEYDCQECRAYWYEED